MTLVYRIPLLKKIANPINRYNYWSCSKFANWLRKKGGLEIAPKNGLQWHEWDEYHERNNTKNKLLNWFIEDGLNIFQDIWLLPNDIYHTFEIYFVNRFIQKSHYLQTGLKKGVYHEVDQRILHGLFETLVIFVEHEKRHMQIISENDKDVRKQLKKKSRRELGLQYLDWEISLGEESQYQSAAAKQVKQLYLWWKDERPNRPDPYEVSGWSDYCIQKGPGIRMIEKTEHERKKVKDMLDECHKLERQYYDEDTQKMTQLIQIRDNLWT